MNIQQMNRTTNLVLSFIFLSFIILNLSVNAQKLKGNGNVVSEVTEVNEFNHLSLKGVFNTTLIQGDKPQVIIETDENLIQTIQIIEDGGKLTIKSKKGMNIKKSTKMNVYVTLQNLDDLEIKGVGNVSTENMLTFADPLNVEIEGVGNTHLQLDCGELDANFSSTGNIELEGKVAQAAIRNTGVGNLNAFDLLVENLEIDNSGIGNVKIYASNTLTIQSSGIGNLEYKGDAEIKDFNVSGIGKVRKL